MKIAKFSLVIAVFLASVAAVGQEKKTPWKVSGDLEEACSCDAACPCWFDSKPTKMTCGGGQVIFIEKGSYGDVPLDGLAIAMMGQSPEGKTMMESIGNWNFLNFYVDEKASPAQRKALEAILHATSPPAVAPEKIKIRYVPITRKISGDEHVVTIGQYASFSGHLIPGGMGAASPGWPTLRAPTRSTRSTARAGRASKPWTTPGRSGAGPTPTTCSRRSTCRATTTTSSPR